MCMTNHTSSALVQRPPFLPTVRYVLSKLTFSVHVSSTLNVDIIGSVEGLLSVCSAGAVVGWVRVLEKAGPQNFQTDKQNINF